MSYIGGWPDFDGAIKSLINKQLNISWTWTYSRRKHMKADVKMHMQTKL